jgi:opacity protein-like surface antigen
MNKIITTVAIAGLLGTVQAESIKPYLSLNIGPSFADDATISDGSDKAKLRFDTGLSFDVAAGIQLAQVPARIEAQYLFLRNDVDKIKMGGLSGEMDGDATINAGMLNFCYDFTNDESPLIVSLIGGVGIANSEFDVEDASADDDTVFAYQVGMGIGYPLSDNLVLDAKYTYFTTADPEFKQFDAEVDIQRFTLGLRYTF